MCPNSRTTKRVRYGFGDFALLFEARDVCLSGGSAESAADLDGLYNLRSIQAMAGGSKGLEDDAVDSICAWFRGGAAHKSGADVGVLNRKGEMNALQVGIAVLLITYRFDPGETVVSRASGMKILAHKR